jgi:nitrite reductase/ring-hydroxylating ferredoxin subunit
MTAWMPVALGPDIGPATSAGAVLDGAEIVVWRDAQGRIHAWEDRCPHRGMKLSFGFVKGDRIACLYHGWEYDGAGQCRYIPAHPDLEVPPTIRTTAWAAAEAAGMVWVAPPGADGPPPGDVAATPVRSLWADVPAAALDAALAAGLPGLGAVARVAAEGPLRRIEQGGVTVLAGLHPVGPGAAALHLCLAGAADAAACAAVARAAAALRRAVEAEAAA